MSVYETDLPGIGRKFDLELADDSIASVVLHHNGRCELYRRSDRDASGEKLLDLTDEEANRLGSILEGAYFESVNIDELTVPLGNAFIEWIEVPAGSSLDGTTLEETRIRETVGTTIMAIQRGTETVPNPDPGFELSSGDLLVAIGTREQHADLADRVANTR